MSIRRRVRIAYLGGFHLLMLCLSQSASGASREGPQLGQPASPDQVAAWNLSIFPDGRGLPPGQGNAAEGKPIYEQHCARCHGPKGIGGSADELAGGRASLAGPHPDKNVGNYWPFATTVFDFIRRSMPLDAPGSLTDDQIYATTAYLLHINGLIDENTQIDAKTLPAVKMPNREGFVWIDVVDTRPQ